MTIKATLIALQFLIFYANTTPAIAYTLDEEILRICGERHPNDFVGRTVCNEQQEKIACVQSESKRVEEIAEKIKTTLDKNPNSKLISIRPIIESFKGTNGKYLRASISIKEGQDDIPNAQKLSLLRFDIDSKCVSGRAHRFGVFENPNREIFLMMAWLVDTNKSTMSDAGLQHSLEWRKSARSVQIADQMLDEECKKKSENLFDTRLKLVKSSLSGEPHESKNYILRYTRSLLFEQNLIENFYPESQSTQAHYELIFRSKCMIANKEIFQKIKIYHDGQKLFRLEASRKKTEEGGFDLDYTWDDPAEKRRTESYQKELKESERHTNFFIATYSAAAIFLGFCIFLYVKYLKGRDFLTRRKLLKIFFPDRGGESFIRDNATRHGPRSVPKDEPIIQPNLKDSSSVPPGVADNSLAPKSNLVKVRFFGQADGSEEEFFEDSVSKKIRDDFVYECSWYRRKKGNYPKIEEQRRILSRLLNG